MENKTQNNILEVANIANSCNISTPLGLAMATKLQRQVPVSYVKNIIQTKAFIIKLPHKVDRTNISIEELTEILTICEPEIVEFFKKLSEKYQVNICKVDSYIDDNIQTMTYIFEYSLEVKHENI